MSYQARCLGLTALPKDATTGGQEELGSSNPDNNKWRDVATPNKNKAKLLLLFILRKNLKIILLNLY